MRVLAIDPGYTTGIAVVDVDGELEASMTVTRRGLHHNNFLGSLVAIAKPDVVLVEELPQNLVSSEMRQLHSQLVQWFRVAGYKVEMVKPAQWKKLVARVEIPGQHARDAATMAKWWINSQKP